MVIFRKPVREVSGAVLSRFAARARQAAGLRGEVTVLVTGNGEIRRLNREFRKQDKPTDVISFPSEAKGIAGDIAISADIAGVNGRELGHGTLAEMKILILHGMLHLAGFDHENDDGAMARREAALRKKLGLPVGLIERSNGSGRTKPAKTKRNRQ